jgi:hypothetical protein
MFLTASAGAAAAATAASVVLAKLTAVLIATSSS